MHYKLPIEINSSSHKAITKYRTTTTKKPNLKILIPIKRRPNKFHLAVVNY